MLEKNRRKARERETQQNKKWKEQWFYIIATQLSWTNYEIVLLSSYFLLLLMSGSIISVEKLHSNKMTC